MRKIKTCSVCRGNSIFQQHNRGWCSTVTMMGMFNQFGHCMKKAVDSPELAKYELLQGEK